MEFLRATLNYAVLGLTVAILGGSPAQALCEATRLLAQIHKSYYLILTEKGDERAIAAARLYPILHSIKPMEFAEALEINAQKKDQWVRIHDDASQLAHGIITGGLSNGIGSGPHSNNLTWIEDVILDSDCFSTSPSRSRNKEEGHLSGSAGGAKTDVPSKDSPPPSQSNASDLMDAVLPLNLILLALAVVGFLAYRSRSFRIVRLGRLPRHTVEFEFQLNLANGTIADIPQTVRVHDLSLGGLKIKVENVLPDGTSVTLHLPTGERGASVVWSNNFFAGILFDQNLSEDEFDRLMQANKETAPAGAEAVSKTLSLQ